MNYSLTRRTVLSFIVMDVLFGPVLGYAFFTLLGVDVGGLPLAIMLGCFALKMGSWSAFLVHLLRPVDEFFRLSGAAQTPQKLVRADRALQVTPLRFASFYGLGWLITFALVLVSFRGLSPEQMPVAPRNFDIGILALFPCFGGSFAFGLPLISLLISEASGKCSIMARDRGVDLERTTSSLPARVSLVAVCIGLAPTMWMTALGFTKQVESAGNHNATKAELAAAQLVNRVVEAEGRTKTEVRGEALAQLEAVGSDAMVTNFVLSTDGRALSGAIAERALTEEPVLAQWLLPQMKKTAMGTLVRPREERIIAFQRIDDRRVAASIHRGRATASSGFLISAGVFALLVAIWAPLTAWLLARAVSDPIEKLTLAARQVVEEGTLTEVGVVPVHQNDEVGLLTEQFNDVLELMRSLGKAANSIAAGDLRVSVNGAGELPDAFRGMSRSLEGIVREIRETSVDLASAAAEIFAASQEQEAAATSQSSAMTEISRTMDSLSESAAHVSEAVQGVLSNAERALKNTDDMVSRIGELSSHAGRIGEILEVIRDIADRSDLLALNGSLEASRAGEGGRGFALVAGEMRRLAERVTASVQDVKKLVSDIRDSGSSTVMATEESKKLAEGTTEAARQITFVTQQQRSGTEQVSHGVKDVAEVIAQAASATTQTRTSAEGLKTQADRLATLVRRFQIAQAETATN
jgi:methyl-accepting chemotaxis protein